MPTLTAQTKTRSHAPRRARGAAEPRRPRSPSEPLAPAHWLTYDATAADTAQLARSLTWAFESDPSFRWLLGEHRNPRARIERFFAGMALPQTLASGEVRAARNHAGAALWIPPGAEEPGLLESLLGLPRMLSICGRTSLRALRAISWQQDLHPTEPHYFLWFLGVDPLSQGRGVGSALMAPVLERCDREGVPAYLEATNERSRDLYLRHGFEITDEVRWPGGGPPLWLMWRAPGARR